MMNEQNNSKTQPDHPENRLSMLWTNPLTLLGLLLVGVATLLMVTFWLFMIMSPSHHKNVYFNIVGYLILPGIFVTGLILCPVGIAVRKLRYRRHAYVRYIPTRWALGFLGISFFLTLPLLGVSGYYGYEYTETSQFCGSCHSVMNPHYTAYQDSPHARVSCSECHIGPGASGLVKSKLSGVNQLFSVAVNDYPKPIPPIIKHLRPVREACERCHWPDKFVGWAYKSLIHYGHQEDNPRYEYELMVKVGGVHPELNVAQGIHLHMAGHVRFVATDELLQEIPWVEYTCNDGTKVVYRSDGEPADAPPPNGDMRRLVCVDCHSGGGHQFHAPQDSVDRAMGSHRIDNALPYIKLQSVAALTKPYEDKAQALEGIEKDITGFYREKYPRVWQEQKDKIKQAVQVLQQIYRRNFFPYMNVDWRTYPINIGHMFWPGCFRCHDGLHKNDQDQAITSNCQACHVFLYEEEGTELIREGGFRHEMRLHDLGDEFAIHDNMLCHECHNGGTRAYGDEITDAVHCGNCHESGRWLEMEHGVNFVETTRPAEEVSLP
jgi:hypothetical protein